MKANAEAEMKGEHAAANTGTYPKAREYIARELKNLQQARGTEANKLALKKDNLFAKNFTGKGAVDVVFGVAVFLVFVLVLPFIALGIKLSSKGPVIFKQLRTGRNGKEFVCYKFRTMHPIKLRRIDGKPIITKKGDRRVFAFGQFLRKTSLDELPQIINVMKGEMSLIGPRPYPVKECAYWSHTFNDFYYRYAVKPGITGLAQTNGYRGGTLDREHMRKRLKYDLHYVENGSIATDLKIAGRTFVQIISPASNAH